MTTHRHEEHLLDRAAMLAMRGVLKLQPAVSFGPEARPGFDTLMARTPAADGVTYAPAVVAGVQGWWCRPAGAAPGAAILYLHGGAYVVGTAWAYRHFVGQIAARAGVSAFVPDYALTPERPFPAAFDDAVAVHAILAKDHAAIAVVGDSAGGGLALGLLSHLGAAGKPRCGVLLSPWADLSLSGESLTSRAAADPLLDRERLAAAATLYLGDTDPRDPRASTLFGDLAHLPPMLIHVGEDEVLLDDARRIAAGIETAGAGTVDLHVWKGMVHVFPANLALLTAAREALDEVGAFLRTHMA